MKTITQSIADVIPPMTHPLARHWDQPDRSEIVFGGDQVFMTFATWKKLREYSASIPSGVYEGKMWRRLDGLWDHVDYASNLPKPQAPIVPLLCWYGLSDKGPEKCSINHRRAVIVEWSVLHAVAKALGELFG